MLRLAILTLVLLVAPIPVAAATGSNGAEPLGPIQYLRLATDQPELSPQQAMARKGWRLLEDDTPNFGYDESVYWYRVPILSGDGPRILEIRYPHLDDVGFWLLTDGVPQQHVRTGDRLPFSQRPLPHPQFLFPFERQAGADHGLLLRIQTRGAHHVPLAVWKSEELLQEITREDQLHALYYGVLMTLTLLSLVMYLGLRQKIYLFYLATTTSFLLLLTTLKGSTFALLWPGLPGLHNYSILLTIPLVATSTLLFSRVYLRLDQVGGWIRKTVNIALIANLVSLAGTLLLDYNQSIRLSVSIVLPTCLLLTVIGPVLWTRGCPRAATYTFAWSVLTLGSLLAGANKYGLLPNNLITVYGVQLGAICQTLTLTVALANDIYRDRESRARSREAELAALSAQRRAEQQVMDLAMRDSLTQLPNRSCFELTASEAIRQRTSGRWAICVLKLNNLGAITKTLGHRNSDRLLELGAQRIQQTIRQLPGVLAIGPLPEDCVAVLDPETFAFVVGAGQASGMQSRLQQLREPIDYLGMHLTLDSSIGVAVYPEQGRDLNALVRQAYVAQESNAAVEHGLAYYDPERDPYSPERLTLVGELRRALENNRLALWFQPKLCLKRDAIVGLEALIRWPDRQSEVPADQLIDLAEQSGLIRPLTRWVMEQALAARSTLLEAGHDLSISINISPNNLRERDFPLFVQRLMTSHHQHRGRLILEVTETSMMQDPVNSLHTLRSLDNAGIPLAIDDFGSGYSSLSYIKRLPACEVKIDRSLVSDLLTHPDDRIIVKTTVDMCHNLGYRVVAEGVEDQATTELLREMGCDIIQGYVLAKPQSMDETLTWLDARNRTLVSVKHC